MIVIFFIAIFVAVRNYCTMTNQTKLNSNINLRVFASFLVAIAGVGLLSDKIFTFELENNFGYNNTPALIWSVVQIVSPVIIIFATFFKPFRISYLVPVYLYFVQLYFVFSSESNDNSLIYFYAIGCVISFLILVFVINRIFRKNNELKNAKISLLEALLDLHIAIYDKK